MGFIELLAQDGMTTEYEYTFAFIADITYTFLCYNKCIKDAIKPFYSAYFYYRVHPVGSVFYDFKLLPP